MRFLLFVVDELGGGCCGVGGDGGVVAVGGAVLLYYDCEETFGIGFWSDWSDWSDGSDGSEWSDGRGPRGWFLWQPRAAAFSFFFGLVGRVAFLVLAEVCRFCANDVRTIL